MSFQAKVGRVLSRQLEAQKVIVGANAVAGTSADPSICSVDNATLAATVITLDIGEPIARVFKVEVVNRTTGAIVALAAAPSTAVANKISVTINGTAQADLAVEATYKVQE